MELKEAIDLAVRECVEENILGDFLEQHHRDISIGRQSLNHLV